ncbi:MAG TPA: CYTH domain-containing protein [Pyrinomonadaceae bacterium]|nr:CYTH domain-containing protein [Pyrinomonadaceae bacterium]
MDLELARPKTAHEIERKFLVKELPVNLKTCESRPIEQGYFAVKRDGTQVRLRKAGTQYSLTFKRGRGIKRQEWEVALLPEQFNELWPTTEGRRLRKTRYDVRYGEYTIEVDIYAGLNKGLIVAEVEFDDERQCEKFQPPKWFDEEVSGKSRYSNVRLARE